MLHGIDSWSAYKVDWPRLRADGFRFAYLRCTVGESTVDAAYAASVEAARKADIIIGAYTYLYLARPIEPQVRHFLASCRDVGGMGDMPVALDLENPFPWVGARVTLDRVLAAARMCEEHFGRRPVIYTSSGWWANLDALAGATLEERAYLASCPLWAAAYRYDPWLPPEDHVGPKFGPWARSVIHQFSGDHSVPVAAVKSDGCPGRTGPKGDGPKHTQPCQRVDRNVFFGTSEELRAFAGLPPETTADTEREPGHVVGVVDIDAAVRQTQSLRDSRDADE